jgi:hypothetical protein
MSLWQIGVWFVGTLGVAIPIVLLILYPAIMAPIIKGIIGFFKKILSYRLGCAILAALAAGFAVDYWRHSHDDAVYAEQTEQFKAAQVARDKRIAQETEDRVVKRIADEAALKAADDKEQKEFHDVAAPLPTGDVVDRVGDDCERLRKLAGQAGCESASHKGVPKAPRKGKPAAVRPDHSLSDFSRRFFGGPQAGQPSH